MPRLTSWHRWRRLLLRLYTSLFLQGWQTCMEVVRTPQLRSVRQLIQKREKLEQEALQLHQQELRLIAQVSTASASQSTLTLAKRDDRLRPLACIMGKGKYLVPKLEACSHCQHAETKHGANRIQSFQKCLKCSQEQVMPLVPIQELQRWNDVMVYLKPDYKTKNEKKEKSVKSEASIESVAIQGYQRRSLPPASSSAPKRSAASVETEEDLVIVGTHPPIVDLAENDSDMEDAQELPPVLNQPCNRCQRGQLMLYRHLAMQHLIWICDNRQCKSFSADQEMVIAYNVLLCPNCHCGELLLVNQTQQIYQCQLSKCRAQLDLNRIKQVYLKMDQFIVHRLHDNLPTVESDWVVGGQVLSSNHYTKMRVSMHSWQCLESMPTTPTSLPEVVLKSQAFVQLSRCQLWTDESLQPSMARILGMQCMWQRWLVKLMNLAWMPAMWFSMSSPGSSSTTWWTRSSRMSWLWQKLWRLSWTNSWIFFWATRPPIGIFGKK